MSTNDTSYDVGDYFFFKDLSIDSSKPIYGLVGKILFIKKRKDGCHRYRYKIILKWGKYQYLADEQDDMIPGSLQFLCSRKINQAELQLIRMLFV